MADQEIEYTEEDAEADRARGRVRFLVSTMAERLYWRWFNRVKYYEEPRSFEAYCEDFSDWVIEEFGKSGN